MVKFSCFSTPPIDKSKKEVRQSVGTSRADYQNMTRDQNIKFARVHSNSKFDNSSASCNNGEEKSSPCSSLGDCWRSGDPTAMLPEECKGFLRMSRIRKSRSLGNMLDKGSASNCDDVTEEDDIDHGSSFDYMNDWNMKGSRESLKNTISTEFCGHEDVGKDYNKQLDNELKRPLNSLYSQVLEQADQDWHADKFVDSGSSSGNLPILTRSFSVKTPKIQMAESSDSSIDRRLMLRRSRSSTDLNLSGLDERLNSKKYLDSGVNTANNAIVSSSNGKLEPSNITRKVRFYNDTEKEHLQSNMDQDFDRKGQLLSMKSDLEHKAADKSESNDNFASALGQSEPNEVEIKIGYQQESSSYNWDQLTPEELSLRRVEHWISQIDLHGDLVVEEPGECSTSTSKEDPQIAVGMDPTRSDARSSLAMEVAYNYISSLTASSSSAQMANLGLIAVPILSAFGSLRILNLSGNAIDRITAGSLPKGLHVLNLSKNNIATVDSLRDLSRLRVLDLSYNRIVKIGHGLASCSALKELYLAGNKISEVEGLHRLLKLNILDLRFNKISTSKGLGQLAANYVSLQAINLEGNPAQRNVGDDQLKKFLLGLLPNLVYYNKQAIRVRSKEVSDRASRADHKPSRWGSHGSGLHKLAPSTQGRQGLLNTAKPSSKLPKHCHVRLQSPPVLKPSDRDLDVRKQLHAPGMGDRMKRSRSTLALRGHYET
ncbi:Dynein light chain 1, axonemal [Apostasia shenzhenica]|uniref:Dynein light chain 1, axonemal n=1 Tax=Apostasia shenzhenica TaxID=1088818 RepID=A0A2I0AA36_9ASPA|nr:Dynein light chain 1, axonemal [Apostasia shenzhenica]